MKKISILLLALLLVIGVWFYFNRNSIPLAPKGNKEAHQLSIKQPETSSVVITSVTNNYVPVPAFSMSTNEPFNALTATNLEQWKASVKNLVRLGGIQFHQDWIFEQQKSSGKGADRNSGIPIILSQNGKTITYTATFINLQTKNGSDSDLLDVDLHTPNMSINETREFGLQLCNMFGWNSSGFLAWCDKTGNRWIDAPLYGTGDHDHIFNIRNTFNNEKPWYIEFDINNP